MVIDNSNNDSLHTYQKSKNTVLPVMDFKFYMSPTSLNKPAPFLLLIAPDAMPNRK